MRHIPALLRTDDKVAFAAILIVSIAAGRMPDVLDTNYPYPAALYTVFTTLAQVIAPVLAVVLGMAIYLRRRSGSSGDADVRDLLRASLLLALPLMLNLVLLGVAYPLYGAEGLRQASIVFVVLLTIWGLVATVVPVAGRILGSDDAENSERAE